MTHTQEVAQIAREISKLLGLNDQLTEAIALAHDIGHTPFGHQGERTLDEILRGKKLKELGLFPDANIDYTALTGNCGNPYGGFKHNFQTVRVLLSLEEGHVDFEGINPTLQVLEGALWHTKARLCCCESCENRSEIGGKNCTDSRCCDPCDFAFNDEQLFHRNEKPCNFSRTLEGQVVAIADEIAQRSHDLDDAFSSELININDLIDICNIRKTETLKTELTHLDNAISKAKQDGRMFTNEDGVRKQAATSLIVKMFIKSVVDSSPDRMRDRDSLSERFHTSDH